MTGEPKVVPLRAPRERSGPRVSFPVEVSPPGLRQTLVMARHALVYCTGRIVVDGAARQAARRGHGNFLAEAELRLDFSEEIKAIDEALAELTE
jgi:hypothetical protein